MALLKSKDDIPDEDIAEMLEEYYRIAKLKGITTDKPDPPSDDEDDDDDDEEGGANPPPPPTRPTVKSPPTTKRAGGPGKNSSIKSPTKSQTATIPEDEKWIDYKGIEKKKLKTLRSRSAFLAMFWLINFIFNLQSSLWCYNSEEITSIGSTYNVSSCFSC